MIKLNNKSIIPFFILLFCISCSNNNIEQKKEIFLENSKIASSLLDSIMYRKDEASPLKNEYLYERFKIVHISDIHISPWTADNYHPTPNNLKEAVRFANMPEMRINAFVATGDLISNNEETTHRDACSYLQTFTNYFYAATNTIPSFLSVGNHDANMLTNNTDYYLSKKELNNILFAKTNYRQKQPIGENYFYADVPMKSGEIFRIISLDNTDQDGFTYNSLTNVCYTQKQIDWLIQTALKENMTEQHHIIILNHHPLQPYSRNTDSYMSSGNHLYNEKMIPDIINAYIKKTINKRDYPNSKNPQDKIVVTADFTNAAGTFICYLGGHTHTPAYFEVNCNDESPAKQIMLLANTLSPDLQNNHYMHIDRERNSNSSNSFSIYAIDTKEQKIYITYFGAKSSNTPTIESVSYR